MSDEKTSRDDMNQAAAKNSEAIRLRLVQIFVDAVPGMTTEEGMALLGDNNWWLPPGDLSLK